MSKAYVVTGASSGIGEAVAKALIARGDRVFAVARRGELLQAAYGCDFCALDLSEGGAAERVARALDGFGPLDGFVHCAGFSSPAPIGMIDEEVARRMLAVHAVFPMEFAGLLAKRVRRAEDCAIVLLTSLAAHEATVGNAAYAAAKGAVEAFALTATAELSVRGIRVHAFDPGIVDTDMVRSTWMRTMSADAVAELMSRHGGLVKREDAATKIIALLDGASKEGNRQ